MGRKYLMGWQGKPYFRWRKSHKGQPYTVTCAELGAMVFTEEGSYKLANAWWAKKLATLEGVPARLDVMQDALDARAEARRRMEEATEEFERKTVAIKEVLADACLGTPPTQNPKVDGLDTTSEAKVDKTFKAASQRWLKVIKRKMKPMSWDEVARYVETLYVHPAIVGKTCEEFGPQTVEDVYLSIDDGPRSAGDKRKRFSFFRRLMTDLIEDGIVPPIKNLASKRFGFKVRAKKVEVYDTQHVRDVLASLPDRLRLYAMLGLNFGLTNCDIGNLTRDMIDGDKLTRKRVKTDDIDNVPDVRYRIWPETAALIVKCQGKHPTYILTGKTGNPLYVTSHGDKTAKKKDVISHQWGTHEPKPPILLKDFRSIAASMLKNHKDYRTFIDYFLGHAPRSMADKHYAGESDALFFEALDWLRLQFFPLTK